MKKAFFYIAWLILTLRTTYAENSWILWNELTDEQVKRWEIHIDDIPGIIKWIIDFWIWIAWTVAVIFIIIWAYQVLFWWLAWDKSKWKNTIIMAISWFAIASLAWFIIRLLIDNLGWWT
jgi:hypothetical protein